METVIRAEERKDVDEAIRIVRCFPPDKQRELVWLLRGVCFGWQVNAQNQTVRPQA